MRNFFKTILIPVDFTINTEVAVQQALRLSDDGTRIHLLHIQDHLTVLSLFPSFLLLKATGFFRKQNQETCTKLLQLKKRIQKYNPAIEVELTLKKDLSIQRAIAAEATQKKADLIIVGKSSNHSWLPVLNTVLPSQLAEESYSAVLTAKPGALHSSIKTVVVPISGAVPHNKMAIIQALCKNHKLNIHLITFVTDANIPDSFSASSLLNVFRWIKSSVECSVEYNVLHGHNKAKAVLEYAQKINADALLVHPETETRMEGWNRHISDVLPPTSKIQVLAVQPASAPIFS